jgi:hypothetical protein
LFFGLPMTFFADRAAMLLMPRNALQNDNREQEILPMALEQLRAEIAMLVRQMEDEPEDIHELHARIRSKLNEIKAMGLPLPDDLVALERRLDGEERAIARAPAPAETERAPRRTVRRKAAKRPAAKKAKAAKAAKKTTRSAAKKSARRPAKAKKTARRSAAKKARRGGRRR